jgi:hypothetical protein
MTSSEPIRPEAMDKQVFELAVRAEEFDTPLRNIRIALDGAAAVFELIPSFVSSQAVGRGHYSDHAETDEALNKIMEGGRPIIEAENKLCVRFSFVNAVVVQEEFVGLHPVLEASLDDLPRMRNHPGVFPFLKVSQSAWKARLPEYQGGDSPDIEHFKLFSMETHVDVLGVFENAEWMPNRVS